LLSGKHYNQVSPAIAGELSSIVGDANVIYGDAGKLSRYSRDQVANPKYGHPPEIVVFATDADQVSLIMKLANRSMIPVTPRGGGSGLSGGAVPLFGGIALALDRMTQVKEIDTQNLVAVVEPGVITKELDRQLAASGLFFAGYPLSEEICTVGGNVAENAGGGRAVKYGVTSRYVLGLEVVLPSGEVMSLGGKRYKDVTGYDLIHLLTGSEGTLGVFTEITLRLLPRPTKRAVLSAWFGDDAAAVDLVPSLLASPSVLPSAIEFLDRTCLEVTEKYVGGTADVSKPPLLLIEIDGNDSGDLERRLASAASICTKAGAEISVASTDEEQERLWKIRKQVPWALKKMNPQLTAEDIVVPVGRLAEILSDIRSIEKKYGIAIPCFGHAADGNIHASPMKGDQISDEQWDDVLHSVLIDVYTCTSRLGGTISGEHGIGHKRKSYLPQVMDSSQISLLKALKRSIDPNLVLNPGKIFDLP
jgi:glycolate oxidase